MRQIRHFNLEIEFEVVEALGLVPDDQKVDGRFYLSKKTMCLYYYEEGKFHVAEVPKKFHESFIIQWLPDLRLPEADDLRSRREIARGEL